MNLEEFYDLLFKKLKSDVKLKPFVCEGNPLDCKVMVIGINPATVMSKPFSDYFNDKTGFDNKIYTEDYINERLQRGKKSKFSNTKNRLNILSEKLQKYGTIITNVFSLPTERANMLTDNDRETLLIEFLIESIKPTVILIHGVEAVESLATIMQSSEKFEIDKCPIYVRYKNDFEVSIFATNHLYNKSYDNTRKIANQIIEHIEKG